MYDVTQVMLSSHYNIMNLNFSNNEFEAMSVESTKYYGKSKLQQYQCDFTSIFCCCREKETISVITRTTRSGVDFRKSANLLRH